MNFMSDFKEPVKGMVQPGCDDKGKNECRSNTRTAEVFAQGPILYPQYLAHHRLRHDCTEGNSGGLGSWAEQHRRSYKEDLVCHVTGICRFY